MQCKPNFLDMLQCCPPDACADIHGNETYPCLNGKAHFHRTCYGGTLVEVEVFHLPEMSQPPESAFYGMHIHEMGDCVPPFDQTGNHYNPTDMPHPMHAGDMPALLGNHGYAYSIFYTERFRVEDIIGHSIVIHAHPDDYMTQPSGNSGDKIGCGVIQRYHMC